MNSYIVKNISIKKSDLIDKGFCDTSLSSRDYRTLICENQNLKPLSVLISRYLVGKSMTSDCYMKKSKYRFLKTVNISNNYILDYSNIEYCKPFSNSSPIHNSILIAKDGGGEGLGEVSIYKNEDCIYSDFICGEILNLVIKQPYLYYVFGMLKSMHFKNYMDVNTPQGSTLRHSKLVALDYKIPFPTSANNRNPDDVIKYLSLIVENILDKEERIQEKNKKIDNLISDELESISATKIFTYDYPKKSEFIDKGRMDTGLYEKLARQIEHKIKNYKNGFNNISTFFNYSRGQNLQISQIGNSYYSKEAKGNFYRLFTNVEMQDNRTISEFRWLGNKNKLAVLPKNVVLLSADGTVGRSLFVDDFDNTITNIHPWIITAKQNDLPICERIFLSMFLSYLRNIGYLDKIKDKANGGGLKKQHLDKWILIPNFPQILKQQIAEEYYNVCHKNEKLTIANYLVEEKLRNEKVGIFQLNMELFALREMTEKIVDDIINENSIKIDFCY